MRTAPILYFLLGSVVGSGLTWSFIGYRESRDPPHVESVEPFSGEGSQEKYAPGNAETVSGSERLPIVAEPEAAAGNGIDLLSHLAHLRSVGDRKAPDWRNVLVGLVREGSPESIEAVLDVMEHGEYEVASTFYSELLQAIEDDWIYPAVRRTLEANIANHLDSWYHADGYLELIARKGGRDGAELVTEMLNRPGQLGSAAGKAVRFLADDANRPHLLEILSRGSPNLDTLATSIASWRDPATTSRMLEIASLSSLNPHSREVIYSAVASNLDVAEVGIFIDHYSRLVAPSDRAAFLTSLGYVGRDSGVSASATTTAAISPIVWEALGDASPEVRASALASIRTLGALHT